MKAESNIMPVYPFKIEYNGDMCEIRFFENVQEVIDGEGEVKYTYDEYLLIAKKRLGIEIDIENNLQPWVQMAKNVEFNKLIKAIREKRNKLLDLTDKYVLLDYPITDTEREKIITYRQQLRDITKQDACPYCVEFPCVTQQQASTLTTENPAKVSTFKTTIPTDRVAALEAKLANIEAIIASPSNIQLAANYVNDEYNQSIQELNKL